MNHARDLERARDEHWYRIPVRSAPKFFPPDYVAFYLTKPFGADAFSVRWYAQVRGHELVTRRDLLPDEPDHPRADQRYYKLQLGKLVELPHPIPSRSLRRITFILTNGKRLNEAWEINDLFLGPREHDLLWRALKEARLHAERNYVIRDASSTRVYSVDFAVICREGTLGVICGDSSVEANDCRAPSASGCCTLPARRLTPRRRNASKRLPRPLLSSAAPPSLEPPT